MIWVGNIKTSLLLSVLFSKRKIKDCVRSEVLYRNRKTLAEWREDMVYRSSPKRESICCTTDSLGFVLWKMATYPYIMTWVEDWGSYGFLYFLPSTLSRWSNVIISRQTLQVWWYQAKMNLSPLWGKTLKEKSHM